MAHSVHAEMTTFFEQIY